MMKFLKENSRELLKLPTEKTLLEDPEFHLYVVLYAKALFNPNDHFIIPCDLFDTLLAIQHFSIAFISLSIYNAMKKLV